MLEFLYNLFKKKPLETQEETVDAVEAIQDLQDRVSNLETQVLTLRGKITGFGSSTRKGFTKSGKEILTETEKVIIFKDGTYQVK